MRRSEQLPGGDRVADRGVRADPEDLGKGERFRVKDRPVRSLNRARPPTVAVVISTGRTTWPVSYRAAAEALWGEAGDRIRRELYPELPVVIGITAYGHCEGLTRSRWSHGPRISLFSSAFGRGPRYVDDILTHELLHVWLALSGLQIHHDSDNWYQQVLRLSLAVLGHQVDARRGADRKSVRVPNPGWQPGSDLPKPCSQAAR